MHYLSVFLILEKLVFSKSYKTTIEGEKFLFFDSKHSTVAKLVAKELNADSYNISKIDFRSGDVVIDIGGNIGVVSIFLAKKYPFLKIYAFEPVKENFENFKKNIQINKIPKDVITLMNVAVTGDGRNVTMTVFSHNTGLSFVSDDAVMNDYKEISKVRKLSEASYSGIVESITLEGIFKTFKINHCKLLKMDCEGCEYEVLYNTNESVFGNIDYFTGELHFFIDMEKRGFFPSKIRSDFEGKFKRFYATSNEGFMRGMLRKAQLKNDV